MDADDGEEREVSDSEQDDEDGDLELGDLDPNAEEQARRVDRQLRRLRREMRG